MYWKVIFNGKSCSQGVCTLNLTKSGWRLVFLVIPWHFFTTWEKTELRHANGSVCHKHILNPSARGWDVRSGYLLLNPRCSSASKCTSCFVRCFAALILHLPMQEQIENFDVQSGTLAGFGCKIMVLQSSVWVVTSPTRAGWSSSPLKDLVYIEKKSQRTRNPCECETFLSSRSSASCPAQVSLYIDKATHFLPAFTVMLVVSQQLSVVPRTSAVGAHTTA